MPVEVFGFRSWHEAAGPAEPGVIGPIHRAVDCAENPQAAGSGVEAGVNRTVKSTASCHRTKSLRDMLPALL